MAAALTAPALAMIQASFVGAGWAFAGGAAWLLVFCWLIPTLARRG